MIDITNKQDYQETSVYKNLKIYINRKLAFDNDSIVYESLKLSEILMADLQLRFGGCNASQLSVSIMTDTTDLIDKDIEVKIETEGGTLDLGIFTIISANKGNKNNVVDIVAIDFMRFTNVDVTDWYNSLTFPMTIKALRDSLFYELGLVQETTTLPLDSLQIQKGYGNTDINANTLLKDICEVNGRFGRMARDGKFKYLSLGTSRVEDITDYQKKLAQENFTTKAINNVIVKQTIPYKLNNGDNPYVLNNMLLNGLNNDTLQTVCTTFLNQVKSIRYTPTSMTMRALPYLELGDKVDLLNGNSFYIFTREITGIQSLTDLVTCEGAEYLENDLNSFQNQLMDVNRKTEQLNISLQQTAEGIELEISGLNGKYNTVKETLDGTVATVGKIEENLNDNYLTKTQTEAVIEQSADNIKLSVTESIEAVSGNLLDNSRYLLGFTVGHFWYDTNGDIIADTEGNPILI